MGLPRELIEALGWLEGLGPPNRVTAIPGNHDVYGHTGQDPGIERWRPFMSGQGASEPQGFPFVKTIGRIAIVGTSSAVPTPPFFATGRLGEAQRRALGERLASLGQSGHCRILLIHHPPLPGQADRLRGLTDSRDLAALLSREGAELVLHGHNHRPMLAFAAGPTGPIPVVGAPSASAHAGVHDPGAGYNLFHIAQQAGRRHIELIRRGYDKTGQIVETERRALLA
jgi:3',5'-cyclic AMP phosphodiesterase CpdA